jgi:thiol-disulfide isomerase/thioredoxin
VISVVKRICLILLLFFCIPVHAYENREITLETGTSLSINEFKGAGKTLLLWLPSERGLGQGYVSTALDLAAQDIDVWTANLHDTYIIPPGRDSLREVDMDDMLALIDYASKEGFNEVFILSSDRGAELALQMAYLWQQRNPQSQLLRGQLMFTPHLVRGRTEIGEDADYVDIASYSNLPVYMFLPQYSPKFARAKEIARALSIGGSAVFTHTLAGVQGGFHMRPEEDLSDRDLVSREQLPQMIDAAMGMLRITATAPITPGYQYAEQSKPDSENLKTPNLHVYQGDPQPQQLILQDINGKSLDLSSLKGEVVLVNFWATWCRPCVEEVPSLSRLVSRMRGKPFKVVSVNVGETPEDIRRFTASMAVNFDILMDRDGKAVRDWKVYAYPSNYLLDKNGNIRYAYRGALEWDSADVIDTIERLF